MLAQVFLSFLMVAFGASFLFFTFLALNPAAFPFAAQDKSSGTIPDHDDLLDQTRPVQPRAGHTGSVSGRPPLRQKARSVSSS